MMDSSDRLEPGAGIASFIERFPRRTGPSSIETTPPPTDPVERPDLTAQLSVRAAARRATEVYTGPVGELVARELHAVAEFGFRFAHDTLTRRLVEHLLDAQPGPVCPSVR